MNKKYYLSSLAAATLLAGCTSDELVPQQNEEVADVLANRPKVEVAFGLETSATRMHGNETGVTFDQEDHLGAVLVDQGLSIPANYYTVKKASGRKNVGKYTYKLTFKGNYKGTKTLTFTINPNYNGNFEGVKPSIEKIVIVKAEDSTWADAIKTGSFN